eukprot:m.67587 g.67587  ORF g.67587 m.67587 type:complete len:433 (-) comp8450_c0_seq1:220-1518(-)
MASGVEQVASKKRRRVRVNIEIEVPKYELEQTPSVKDGLSKSTEDDIRVWCCQFIQDTGILLRMPQVVMACAQILFQRFYYRKSMVAVDVQATALACLFVAAKVEEAPQSLRNVIHTGHHVQQKSSRAYVADKAEPSMLDSNDYAWMKNEVIKAERRVLKELGFCVHLKHPHKLIISYQKLIGLASNRELSQLAWNYMNDGLRTSVFIRYPAPVIACACLHLGTLKLGIPIPEWWQAFDVTTVELESAAAIVLELYERPRCFLEDLLDEITKARKAKHKVPAAARPPPSSSSDPRPKTAVNAALIDRMTERKSGSPLIRGTVGSGSASRAGSAAESASPTPRSDTSHGGHHARARDHRDRERERDRHRSRSPARHESRGSSRESSSAHDGNGRRREDDRNRKHDRDRDRDRDRNRSRDRHRDRGDRDYDRRR